uniref:protocadherin-10-like isoform X2 n=1 Tax=Myxine glutinosa TaxID=7769 RepID=UPI00358E14DB
MESSWAILGWFCFLHLLSMVLLGSSTSHHQAREGGLHLYTEDNAWAGQKVGSRVEPNSWTKWSQFVAGPHMVTGSRLKPSAFLLYHELGAWEIIPSEWPRPKALIRQRRSVEFGRAAESVIDPLSASKEQPQPGKQKGSWLPGGLVQLQFVVREETPPGSLVGDVGAALGLSPAELTSRGLRALPGTNGSTLMSLSSQSGQLRLVHRLDREALCRGEDDLPGSTLTLTIPEDVQSEFSTKNIILDSEKPESRARRFALVPKISNWPLATQAEETAAISKLPNWRLSRSARHIPDLHHADNLIGSDVAIQGELSLLRPFPMANLHHGSFEPLTPHSVAEMGDDIGPLSAPNSPTTMALQTCVLLFEAVLARPLAFVRVSVKVVDVNDHSPRFAAPHAVLEVSESAPPGTRLPLEPAHDPDAGSNGHLAYELQPAHGPFSLGLAATGPELLLQHSLDREQAPRHALELRVQDRGEPARSASARILVRVLDANDNAPVFGRPLYHARITEDAPPGTQLVALQAWDPDEGANGEVRYALGALTSARARHLFGVDARTGRVSLRGRLNYEDSRTHEFPVEARDRGVNAVPAYAKVLVSVLDVNDNPPQIQVLSLAEVGGSLVVLEDAAPGALIALVRVTDSDADANGHVSCMLLGAPGEPSPPFSLRSSAEPGEWAFVTSGPLDRERAATWNLTLVARDEGTPPLATRKTVSVTVGDVNDNGPLFGQPRYEFRLHENNVPGAYLGTVSASDLDLGSNGRLAYSLVDSTVGGMPAHTYVSVNPATGALYALRAFDHEQAQRLAFTLRATDSGVPPQQAEANVSVLVQDRNDNAPVFVNPPLGSDGEGRLVVPSGVAAGRILATVKARDADAGDNGRIAFTIQDSGEATGLFKLDAESGELRASRMLLPSDVHYRILLSARDHGERPRSSTATVWLEAVGSRSVAARDGLAGTQAPTGHRGSSHASLAAVLALAGLSVALLAAVAAAVAVCCKRSKALPGRGHRGKRGRPRPEVTLVRDALPTEAALGEEPEGHPGKYRTFLPSNPGLEPQLSPEEKLALPAAPGRQPDLLLGSLDQSTAQIRHFLDPSTFGSRQVPVKSVGWKEPDRLSFKDSGQGDSEPAESEPDTSRGSYGDGGLAAVRGEARVHAHCTAECRVLGHSDRCWMPPDAILKPPADGASSFTEGQAGQQTPKMFVDCNRDLSPPALDREMEVVTRPTPAMLHGDGTLGRARGVPAGSSEAEQLKTCGEQNTNTMHRVPGATASERAGRTQNACGTLERRAKRQTFATFGKAPPSE